MLPKRRAVLICLLGCLPALSGCVLAPPEIVEEREKLAATGATFEPPVEIRDLPELPLRPSWQDMLCRAFLANGDLESSYFNWKGALIQVNQAAAWPNSRVALSYSYMFSRENMKAWDRMTISAGFDPSMNLQLPIKVEAAGRVAFEAAREAGERFRVAKFDLQRRVLNAYLDLALAAERARIERDNVNLLKQLAASAAARAQAGGPMQDLLKVETDSELAKNNLRNLEAEVRSARSVLNGLLARDPTAPLEVVGLPPPRSVIRDDSRLIAIAVDRNPELAALARQVAGRENAVEQALLAYLPDISPTFSINGSISQTVGAMVMLPTTLPQIQASIDNAEAMVRSAQAVIRQTGNDRAASFVAALYFMRNAERQTNFFHRRLTPLVEQLLVSSREAYAAGTVAFADLIDSKRTYINIRRLVAEARIERERRLAEMEALAGVDIETLGRPALIATIEPPPLPQYKP
ncbi:TolC family protein [Methylocystis echinoides]|uniref:TolC family protein n=1 Tax=Methylocystis echinoides TaxID=29468 RepID=UPI002492ACFD|nr:TolC family protein [Methylocystis echinoides]